MVAPADALANYVRPALIGLNLHSVDAERLLMGTAAVESNFVNFVQFGRGPARGMFQMEPATFDDIINRYLAMAEQAVLRDALIALASGSPPRFDALETDHLLAAGLARVRYHMVQAGIPSALKDQAEYWWVHYNCESPHGLKPADYLARWEHYCKALYPDFY
ncbi:MAG TPA: hypothetical protein VMB34_29755 [Acetobacteraceae bacterium]|nr:hypothetical protein [Acetobacteraceae bacterium]